MISSDSTNIRLDGTDTLVVLCMYVYMYTHTHPFNGFFFRDYPGEPVPERYDQSGFY